METVKIGWGRREITTNEPVDIAGLGYIRVSKGVNDPLFVTALCVDGGAGMDAAIFLSTDVATVYANTLQPILDTVAAKNPEIPVDAIILNATHTHTAPTLGNTPETTPDGRYIYPGSKYRAFFVQMCAEAVCEAWETRAEGGIGYGYGFAVVAHSRRTVYFEEKAAIMPRSLDTPTGYAQMYGTPKDPLFSHFEAGADHYLNVMFTFDADKKLTGMVVNVPCPSQNSELLEKLSADYWNEVRQFVSKEFGEDVYVLPQCAAAGDLAPRMLYYMGAQERRMRLKYGLGYDRTKTGKANEDQYRRVMGERMDIAERIVAGIKDVYSWAKKEILTQVPVRHHREVMALERRKITDEEKAWCEENLELLKEQEKERESRKAEMTPEEYSRAVSSHQFKVRRNKMGIDLYEDVKEKPTLDMISHVVQIGDIAFATIRFELYQDFMHRLQGRSPFMQTFVVQLCGDEGGNYLATERAVAGKGYSASMFCNKVSPNGGHQWVENCLKIMQDMKEKDNA